MPERTLTRIGAAAAVLGAVLGLVVNVLHPRVNDPANTKAFLRQVAESTIWVGDHVGIIFAVLLVTGGLVAVYRSITSGPGAAWARLGFAAALVSAGLGFVTVAVERSEEHTSELQSPCNLVCRLLLEKKKTS